MWDIEQKLRTKPALRQAIIPLVEKLIRAEEQFNTGRTSVRPVYDIIEEILIVSDYNLFLILPFFYPKAFNNSPLSFDAYSPVAPLLFPVLRPGFVACQAGRQIGKTIAFCVRQRTFSYLLPGFRTTYIVPRSKQLSTYTTKFRSMESYFRFAVQDTQTYRQNLTLKEYPNASLAEMTYVHKTPDNVRGKSTDEIIYDEFQDFNPTFIREVEEISSASRIPFNVFAGTAKSMDTALQAVLDESSACEWTMKCPACGHQNQPTDENDVMDMVQRDGLYCSKCLKKGVKTKLDVSQGLYVPAYPERVREHRHGIHVPQVIVPEIVNDPVRWSGIYAAKNDPRVSTKKFKMEILGIAQDDGEREITLKQLQAICTLPAQQALKKAALSKKYKFIVSGMDWGGNDDSPELKIRESYTCQVILGVTHDGYFHILWMEKHEGMAWMDIAEKIAARHREYARTSKSAMGADRPGGHHYNEHLRTHFIAPNYHLIYNYHPSVTYLGTPKDMAGHMFNTYLLNRNESISFLYQCIRDGRLLCYDWEHAAHCLEDILNVIRFVTERNETGERYIGYRRHGSRPDDILHALNYAITTARLLLNEALFTDSAAQHYVSRILAGAPPEEAMVDPALRQFFS